jgi:hypothetical protein
MQHDDLLLRYRKLVSRLADLPKKMVALYDLDAIGNIPEFVLQDLCHEDCFNLKKAAFLVDNPDFDYLKGIAGFSKEERFKENHWEDPRKFNDHMNGSNFNKLVKAFCDCSYKKNNKNNLDKLARELSLENFGVKIWPLKHYNHGFLLYERELDEEDEIFDQSFLSSLHILSFCPLH